MKFICSAIIAVVTILTSIKFLFPGQTTDEELEKLFYWSVAIIAILVILIVADVVWGHFAKRRRTRQRIADLIKECEDGLEKFWSDYPKIEADLNIFKQFYAAKYWKRFYSLLELAAQMASKKNFNLLAKKHEENKLINFRVELKFSAIPNLNKIAQDLEETTINLDHARVKSHELIDRLPAMIKSAQATYRELPDQKLIASTKNNFEDAVIASAGKSNEIDWLEVHGILCYIKRELEDIQTAAEERKQAATQEEQARQTAPKRLEALSCTIADAKAVANQKPTDEKTKSLLSDADRILSAAQLLTSMEPCSWSKVGQLLNAAENLYCEFIDRRSLDELHNTLCTNCDDLATK